ncbi:MAG TPA: phospholipid carrier-dependent glycosyltransferase [Candidatus Dormibacteraeota bacterium]
MTTVRRALIPARWLWMHRRHPRAPLWLLGVVSLLSLGARLWYLSKPADSRTHVSSLIFDEAYYVNAARVILGIHPPAGANYAAALLGHDPNAEHPPLAKLLFAGSMKVLGDNAWGWRIFPIIFGSIAILATYWLVRSARGSSWLALGAATLMAVDNLLLIHGRIATLDIFVVTFMLVAVALYLRGHPLLAGITLGVGLCTKLVAVDVVFVIAVLEIGRVIRSDSLSWRARLPLVRARAIPLLTTVGVGAVTYLAVLFGLDLIASPIGGAGSCATVPGGFHNPITHTNFMLCYAGKLTNPGGPTGIASYPWQWLLNELPINYFNVANNVLSNGKVIATHPVVAFQGEMNPAIILLALPALALAAATAWQRRDTFSLLCVAWFLGTFLPFVLAAAPIGIYGNRTSYIYYMVIVMPAVYLAVAQLFSRQWLPRAALLGYVVILGYWFVTLYPFQTWSGS